MATGTVKESEEKRKREETLAEARRETAGGDGEVRACGTGVLRRGFEARVAAGPAAEGGGAGAGSAGS